MPPPAAAAAAGRGGVSGLFAACAPVAGAAWPGSQELSEEQRAAAAQPAHTPLVVFAPAGSGKTTTLVHRVLFLHYCQGLRAERLLCLTFTRKAADELRGRLRSSMPGGVTVATFHSWCLRLLRSFGQHVGQPTDFQLSSSSQQLGLLQEAVLAWHVQQGSSPPTSGGGGGGGGGGRGGGSGGRGGGGGGRGGKGNEALNALCRKLQHAMLAAKTEGARSGRGSGGGLLATEMGRFVCQHYAAALRRAGLVDMADLQAYALRLLGIPEVLQALQARVGHLLIDEFQDTNLQQLEIVRRLRGEPAGTGVTVVGDDDQAIYSWRGAEPRVFALFGRHVRGASVAKLTQNFRSTGAIVRASAAAVAPNEGREPKATWTKQTQGPQVEVCECRNEACERDWVLSQIRALARVGIATSRIAVLYRTHAIGRPLFHALREASIPCAASASDVFARPDVRALLQVLRLLTSPAADDAFRAVNAATQPPLPPRCLEQLAAEAASSGLSLLESARLLHSRGSGGGGLLGGGGCGGGAHGGCGGTLGGGGDGGSVLGGSGGGELDAEPAVREALHRLLRLIDELREAARRLTAAQLLQEVIRSRLIADIRPEAPPLGAKLLAEEMGHALREAEDEAHHLSFEQISALTPQRPPRPSSAMSNASAPATPRPLLSAATAVSASTPLLPRPTPRCASTLQQLAAFLQHHAFCEHEQSGAGAGRDTAPGVTLSTIHGAKGREWDAVLLVRVNEDTLPLSQADYEEDGEVAAEHVREERRLLYVAMTRARRHLAISYTMVGPDNVPASASRFLRNLPAELIERAQHFELTHATSGDTGGAGFAQRAPPTPRPSPRPSPRPGGAQGLRAGQAFATPLRAIDGNEAPGGGGGGGLFGGGGGLLGGGDNEGGGGSSGRISDKIGQWRARHEELKPKPKGSAKTPKPKGGGATKATKPGAKGGQAAATSALGEASAGGAGETTTRKQKRARPQSGAGGDELAPHGLSPAPPSQPKKGRGRACVVHDDDSDDDFS
jgi:superfamily I DNA/RNA helicase